MNRQASESNRQIDPEAYIQKIIDWSTSDLHVLAHREQLRSEGRPSGIWTGFSRFQSPVEVLEYAGEPAAHLLLYLYSLGAGVSKRASYDADVRFSRLVETLARGTGLSARKRARKVERALERLKNDHRIEYRQERKSDGSYGAGRIYLLEPSTGRRLPATGRYGLLSGEPYEPTGPFDYITVTRHSLEAIHKMKRACEKATYIAALAFVSRDVHENVSVEPQLWWEVAHLSRSSFYRGLRYCECQQLLSYKKNALTLFDPLTKKPVERWRHPSPWVVHENSTVQLDFKTVLPEHWRFIVEDLFGESFPEANASGWTRMSEEIPCPFCKARDKFAVNWGGGSFCHGCRQKNGLAKLIQHMKGFTTMGQTKEYILERLDCFCKKELERALEGV